MTFNDIFQSSFLEKTTEFSIIDIGLAMLVSFSLGLFIFLVYKKNLCGCYVFCVIWYFHHGDVAYHDADHPRYHYKYNPFAWYGWRAFYRPFSYTGERTSRYRLPVLVNFSRDRDRCRLDPARCFWVIVYWHCPSCFHKQEKHRHTLHHSASS